MNAHAMAKRLEGAELATVAAALYAEHSRRHLFANLTADELQVEGLGALWTAAGEMYDGTGKVAEIMLRAAGQPEELLQRLGDLKAEASLSDPVSLLAELRATQALSELQNLLAASGASTEDATASRLGVEQVTAGLEYGLQGIADRLGQTAEMPSMSEEVHGWAERLLRGEDEVVCTWGIPRLDELVGGLRPGSLHVPIANPGGGKSSLAMTAALATARRGYRVLYVSREMTTEDLGIRIAAMSTGRTKNEIAYAIRKGTLDPAELKRHVTPLIVGDQKSSTVSGIRAALRRAKAEANAYDLVVVDYLQMLTGPEENEAQRLEAIAYGLSGMALDYECCVIAPAQPNRQSDGTDLPRMRQIKGSSGIESAADSVIAMRALDDIWNRYGCRIAQEGGETVLYTETGNKSLQDYDDAKRPHYRDVRFGIEKARNGTRGDIDETLRFGCGTFIFWDGPVDPWMDKAQAARAVDRDGSHAEAIPMDDDELERMSASR